MLLAPSVTASIKRRLFMGAESGSWAGDIIASEDRRAQYVRLIHPQSCRSKRRRIAEREERRRTWGIRANDDPSRLAGAQGRIAPTVPVRPRMSRGSGPLWFLQKT